MLAEQKAAGTWRIIEFNPCPATIRLNYIAVSPSDHAAFYKGPVLATALQTSHETSQLCTHFQALSTHLMSGAVYFGGVTAGDRCGVTTRLSYTW